jgi:DNA-binding CsgD family transcriptional regulator
VRAELRGLARDLPLVFGGVVSGDELRITELFGHRTSGLRNLVVPTRFGLGGRVLAQRKPAVVEDYARCEAITHDFDRPVLREGITSVLAVPVLVAGRPRAVLYGAVRDQLSLGSRAVSAVVAAAARLGSELRVRDEVEARLRHQASGAADAGAVRDVHAELRSLASTITDTDLAQHLLRLSEQLVAPAESSGPALSRREVDVLTHVALGRSNADIAQRLGVLPETVKSYLRSASAKLGTSSRLEAVAAARRQGLLP